MIIKVACLQCVTSTAYAQDANSKASQYALPPKPRPASRPALQSVSMNSPDDMLYGSLQSSGPFPGVTKSVYSKSSHDQMPSFLHSTSPDPAILAQHAIGMHGDVYASSPPPSSIQSHTAVLPYQANMNSTHDQQASDRAACGSLRAKSPAAAGNENALLDVPPQYMTLTQPQPASDTATTVNRSGESDNAYVSFDEWQAQVHAKQLRTAQSNRTAAAGDSGWSYSGSEYHPFAWLSKTCVPGSAPRASNFQYNQ